MALQHRPAVFYFKPAEIRFKIFDAIAMGELGNRFYICAAFEFIFQIHDLRQIYNPDPSAIAVQQFDIFLQICRLRNICVKHECNDGSRLNGDEL